MAFLLAVGLVGLVPVAGVAGLVIYNHREPPVTKPNVPQSTEQTRQVVQPTGKGPILSRQTGSPGPTGPAGTQGNSITGNANITGYINTGTRTGPVA